MVTGTGSADSLFAGPGKVSRAMAARDWSATPVGPPEQWPASLRSIVRVLLTSRFSMWLGWGSELAFFYNDAYHRDTLRDKHPWALGQPAREVWAEIWDAIGPRIQSVLTSGEATWDEQLPLRLERAGYPEETYHTFSYSPLADDDGRVVGMLCVVREDTERVLAERRLRVLRELGDISAVTAPTIELACAAAVEVLTRSRVDVPFGSVYLLDRAGDRARRAAHFGMREDPEIVPTEIDRVRDADQPLWRVLDAKQPTVLTDLAATYRGLFLPHQGPVGCAEPDTALAVPLAGPGGGAPLGVLFAGISPFLVLNDEYRRFVDLVAGQVANALADAQASQTQRRRAEELAELDRVKTEFFTGVSHELRTPLTLISGPAEDALSDTTNPLAGQQRTRMELVARNAGRLRRLVDTLLEFSQLEAGRLVPHPSPVDLAALTRGLAESFAPAVRRAGLDFGIDCPPLDSAVMVDGDMWEKIVLNLLSNAVKYTLTGRVEVALRPGPAGGVLLRVTDTGIGIPAGEHSRLFERFHRVRGAVGRSHEGSGIGLALVAELTGLHGGAVAVDSEAGRGSVFTVELPATAWTTTPATPWEASSTARLYREEALQWSADRPGSALDQPEPLDLPEPDDDDGTDAAGGVARVLVAEDNADLRRFIAGLLRPNYAVSLAPDGAAALELARTRRPDLVLTDVMMPGLDGFELLGELRAHPSTATIPVIMLSARAGPEAVEVGLAAGADDYLVKPFSSHDLLARVRSNLALARLRNRESAWRVALLNNLSDGLFVLDGDRAVVEINEAFSEILGYGAEGMPYRWPHPWWPDPEQEPAEHTAFADALAELATLDGGARWRLPARHRDGHRVWVEVSMDPLSTDLDGDRRVVGLVRDVTDQYRATVRDRLLADIGRALAQPGDLADRLAACARSASAAFDDVVLITRSGPDGHLDPVAAAHPSRPDLAEAAMTVTPRHVPAALADRYRAGRAFVLAPVAVEPPHRPDGGPGFDRAVRALGGHTTLVAPLLVAGRLHGMLVVLSAHRRRAYDDAELALVEELAVRLGGAMETDWILTRERRLHEASAALAAAATVRDAAAALGTAVVEAMGASVVLVFLHDPTEPHRLRLRHTIGWSAGDAQRFDAGVRLDDRTPVSDAARTGRPVWMHDRQDWWQAYPNLADDAGLAHIQATAALPLKLGDRVLGVLFVGFPRAREFAQVERAFAMALVSQAAQAFARAAVTDARWQVSRTLQKSLLPAALPDVDRIAWAAHYQPAGQDIQAGGDWYDMLVLDGQRVAIVVGDVVGSGALAAATMGKLSSALAAYLREGHGPGRALDLLSEYAATVGHAVGSTAVCLILSTRTGELRGACAGHPPPLLLAPGHATHHWHDLTGVALGVPRGPRHGEERLTLTAGTSLIVYTDGLVERRREVIDDGLRRLADAVADHADAAPSELLATALTHCLPPGSPPADDVALVVTRYLPQQG